MSSNGEQSVDVKRKPGRILLVCMGLILGLPPLYIQVATPPAPSISLPTVSPNTQYDLYVADWGYHTTLIVQQPQGWKLGPETAPNAPFVEYSWGDRNFYIHDDFSPIALFATLFLPTPSVLHIKNWSQAPTTKSGIRHLYHRKINAEQLRTLVSNLEASFKTSQRPVVLPPVPRFRGSFYPAREFYIFWSTCNAWTVNHLARVGLAQSAWHVVIAQQVAPQLRGFQPLSSP